jgi:hypothetical protein
MLMKRDCPSYILVDLMRIDQCGGSRVASLFIVFIFTL